MSTNFMQPILQISDYSFKCQGELIGKFYCQNLYCREENPFICTQKSCICYDIHKMCQKKIISTTIQKIYSKIVQPSKICKMIHKFSEELVCQLNSLVKTIINTMNQQVKYANLTPTQKQFVNIMQRKSCNNKLCGARLNQLGKSVNKNPQKTQKLLDYVLKSYQSMFQDTKIAITCIEKSLSDFIKNQKQSQLQAFKINSLIHRPLLQNKLLIEQKVVIQQLLPQIFNKEKPSHAKCVFRASQSSFNIKKFYKNCSQIKNILIVCLPKDSSKLVGGFSTQNFKPTGKLNYVNDQWVKDKDRKSFLFVYEKNQRKLQRAKIKPKRQIMRRDQYQQSIQFGYHQFNIGNQANITQKCKFELNNVNYKLPKHFNNYKEFQNFTAVEWQAWQIQWNIQKQVLISKSRINSVQVNSYTQQSEKAKQKSDKIFQQDQQDSI